MKPSLIGKVATAALVVDQVSKWTVLEILDLAKTGTQVVVPDILKFVLAWNTGINFGLFSSEAIVTRIVLVAIPIAVSLGLLWWARRSGDVRRRVGVGLVAGGALSNALDRVVHGAVVDFLNVSAFGLNNPFSFNIADVWVFAGFGLILLSAEQRPTGAGDAEKQKKKV